MTDVSFELNFELACGQRTGAGRMFYKQDGAEVTDFIDKEANLVKL